jgi:hypothetical protein
MKPGMPVALVDLLERYCSLGRLLPRGDLAEAFEDPFVRTDAEVVLREMAEVKARIDNFLDPGRPGVAQGLE